ncbi:Retinoblastoma-like protein 1 107 kDa retinoblastoma-associated protein [Triplophysa tibetana]|uniref:Retinoblastoma-like protein 1 n=1 Tax=Triplophysa tibetana TaxID=1572043 RepID=A0A5A9NUJ4_9TELE|nr:Retinoblastoma-like protein 1 107 kDa retinoblastoma-associated protein [Triplophysa tibetana]
MRGDETDSESVKSDDGSVRRSLDALCQELNMDEETATEAFQNFTSICNTYTLEGDVVHWLACALYAACRKSSIPTVGRGVMEGNCVSLTRILRSSKLSLIQFFSKMKKWSDMSNLSQDFRNRVRRLERNFEVSTVIFRKFEPIFLDMFQDPQGEPPRLSRSRKHRRLPCHISDVFKFCWTLFVYTKGNFRMIGDDLVNSYHLLLCCLDLVFCNALLCSNKKDLINQYFRGLPKDAENVMEMPFVIDKLCELHDGLVVEAKGIKEHYFKPYMKRLFEKRILKGDPETLNELLDIPNFQDNNKAINREYEEYVLTVGDFDERVFLGADADEEIGTPRKSTAEPPAGQMSARMQVESNLQQHFEKTRSLAPSTPLTGRRYLKEKEVLVTPVSSATQSVSRLQSMVSGLRNAPSSALLQIFNSCSRNPTEAILNRVKTMGESFKEAYTKPTDDLPGAHMDFAENRLKLAEIFYFKILENIMTQEMKRLQGKDMTVLLEQEVLHCSLLACCLELVLFAYSSQRTFPWILEIFKIPPFYFYKVIEVFIRSEEGLSRDMVKHLNGIEEQVLESKAWTRDSALWNALSNANNKLPTVEEVNFPSSFDTGNSSGGPTHLPLVALSPIIHPRIREVRTGLGSSARKDLPQSPVSLHDRFSSPAAGSAKRRLFGDDPSPQSPVKRFSVTPIKIFPSSTENNQNLSSTTLLSMSTANGQQLTIPLPVLKNEMGGITVIQLQANDMNSLTAQVLLTASPSRPAAPPTGHDPQPLPVSKPRRTGSLALFFRKVYHLASVRLRDLCLKLDISADLRGKIWTCFEHSLLHCTDLMKDRHLDQLLLCAVYIIAKITKEDHTFQDIMKCYRTQPQANSHVYRSVLLKRRPIEQQSDENMEVDPPSDRSNDRTEQFGSEEADSELEERGDLIQFYNSVYVLKMKSFALRYAHSAIDGKMEAPPLSPFPSVRAQPLSPRRVSQRHSIFVSPHKNSSSLTPSATYTYKFTGSPSKELNDINQMIRQSGVSKKRAFTMEGDETESPSKCLRQENDDVLLKRLQDVVSERASL